MIDHDKNVGTVLKALDDAGHRGQHVRHVQHRQRPAHEHLAGRRHDPVPQREELELGRRLPRAVHGPLAGQDQAGHASRTRSSATTTGCRRFLAMAGDTEVTEKLLKGYKVGDMTYKVHLDGYNLVPYLTGQAEKSPRESFIYCNDDQQVTGLRYDNWKLVFMEQRAQGTLRIWAEPFTTLRVPKIFNLRLDPVRAGGHHVEHLLRLAARPRLPAGPGPGLRGQVPDDVQGVPAAAEGRQLQPR